MANEYKRNGGVDGGVNAFLQPLDIGVPDDAIDVEANGAVSELVVRGLQTTASELGVLGEDFANKLIKGIGQEFRKAQPQDPLGSHDFLSKAAEKNYLLTGELLAEGMRMRPSTIANWSDEVEKFGFLISRVGKGQWRVRTLPS
jgi:hypothetical protein